ncbi:MAG TPA: response regulator [Bradyrhizobium sp.]|nr:response regulator [Bradyrhizobium sp.]
MSAVTASCPEAGKREIGRVPRVLIVDDDQVQLDILVRAARLAGCEAVSASSCGDASRLVASSAFDCVLLDLELADGDGIDVCRTMADTKYSGRVIIVSGTKPTRRSAARATAKFLGIATQSLPKPVDLASLRVCLANLGKGLSDLPALHAWGGAAMEQTLEGFRA